MAKLGQFACLGSGGHQWHGVENGTRICPPVPDPSTCCEPFLTAVRPLRHKLESQSGEMVQVGFNHSAREMGDRRVFELGL